VGVPVKARIWIGILIGSTMEDSFLNFGETIFSLIRRSYLAAAAGLLDCISLTAHITWKLSCRNDYAFGYRLPLALSYLASPCVKRREAPIRSTLRARGLGSGSLFSIRLIHLCR
jgi:hypothetical protein